MYIYKYNLLTYFSHKVKRIMKFNNIYIYNSYMGSNGKIFFICMLEYVAILKQYIVKIFKRI